MVWGGKGANGTWFSALPEHVHGINWLPIQGGSLYLGHYPAYVEKNYAALVQENGGIRWKAWADLIWMYRALVDPQDALRQFEAAKDQTTFEPGNSKAHTLHWISSLNTLGQVDAARDRRLSPLRRLPPGANPDVLRLQHGRGTPNGDLLRWLSVEGPWQRVCDSHSNEMIPVFDGRPRGEGGKIICEVHEHARLFRPAVNGPPRPFPWASERAV